MDRPVNSPETMIAVIRRYGILPLFKSSIPGWSIEDKTAPGCWFDTEGVLGPWDWKIEAVQQGDIAYGRFIGGKAAFATVDWYRHLMNWRRSLPVYRMAVGGRYKASTKSDRLNKSMGPVILDAIEKDGEIKAEGIHSLFPTVKKNTYDGVVRYLQMGTWVVVGDIERVYRGPNLTYSGWQRTSLTSPDQLFGTERPETSAPAWAKLFEAQTGSGNDIIDCTPEESRQRIISHIQELTPEATTDKLIKLI
ncbi:MAG: hypothetical protein IJM89_02095 [Bacteroidales bacterium]|nr:hypothetical protein [Bacteroidales bacterium]